MFVLGTIVENSIENKKNTSTSASSILWRPSRQWSMILWLNIEKICSIEEVEATFEKKKTI